MIEQLQEQESHALRMLRMKAPNEWKRFCGWLERSRTATRDVLEVAAGDQLHQEQGSATTIRDILKQADGATEHPQQAAQ